MSEARPVDLVGLDVDGTIVGLGGLYRAAGRLFDACGERDVTVALCSARPLGSLQVLAGRFPCIRYAAALQGSDVWRLGGVPAALANWTISRDIALDVSNLAIARGHDVWWYAAHRWFVAQRTEAVEREVGAAWVGPVVGEPFDSLPAPNKLLVVGHAAFDDPELQARCAAAGLGTRRSQASDLEVISGSVPSTKGLDVIATHLGVDAERVAAVGDGANDEGMLRFAGHSFALPPVCCRELWPGVHRLPPPDDGGLDEVARFVGGRS